MNMLAADGLRSLMLMQLFPWASATHIHILVNCDERCFDFGPGLLSVMVTYTLIYLYMRQSKHWTFPLSGSEFNSNVLRQISF